MTALDEPLDELERQAAEFADVLPIRVLPHNLANERAALGAWLLSPDVAAVVMAANVDASDFYSPGHGAVFTVLCRTEAAGDRPDPVTVANHATAEELAVAGGRDAFDRLVTSLPLACPSTKSAGAYFKRVVAQSRLRSLVHVGAEVSEAARAGDEAQALSILERAGSTFAPPTDALAEATLTTEQLKALKVSPPLIAGYLPLDSIALLYGPSGAGKTFVVVDWVLHVQTGSWWHGQEVRSGPVVCVLGEGASRLGQRVTAWQEHHGIHDLERFPPVWWITRPVNLHDPAEVAAFIAYVKPLAPVLISFDTLARNSLGADENSARDMGRVMHHVDLIRRATGACVLLVHHTGKDADRGSRGSTAVKGALDTEIEVTGNEQFTVRVTKQKDGPEALPRNFERKPIGASCVIIPGSSALDPDQLPAGVQATLDALAKVEVAGGVSTSTWKTSAEATDRTFFRHRKGLVDTGLVVNVGTDKSPRYVVATSSEVDR